MAASGAAAPALPAAEPKKKRRRRGESAASGAAALEEPKQKRRKWGDGAASAACAAAAAEPHESTGADLEDTLKELLDDLGLGYDEDNRHLLHQVATMLLMRRTTTGVVPTCGATT